jgi:hypothetical protein
MLDGRRVNFSHQICVWRKFWDEFGGSFGMSLEGDFREVEITSNLEFLVTFDMNMEGGCMELSF